MTKGIRNRPQYNLTSLLVAIAVIALLLALPLWFDGGLGLLFSMAIGSVLVGRLLGSFLFDRLGTALAGAFACAAALVVWLYIVDLLWGIGLEPFASFVAIAVYALLAGGIGEFASCILRRVQDKLTKKR